MNQTKFLSIGIFILFIASFNIALAANDPSELNITNTINEIQETQQVDSLQKIDCDKVTDEQLEELGEASMGIMHPDSKQHELMDKMMGGEGSESLKAAHIMMGSKYLGCSAGMGMMGGKNSNMSMMSHWGNDKFESGKGCMMGNSIKGKHWGSSSSRTHHSWIFYIIKFIILGLFIVGIILLTRFFMHKGKEESSLQTLKKRYAKGEINKKEFEAIKKDIT